MSGSMFVGRVLLPGLGLALTGILVWQAWRGSNGESRVPFALASLSGSGPLEPASPSAAPQRAEKRQLDSPSIILAEGHVAAYPGAEVVVGAELPGTITRILVQEKSPVRKGQLLVEFRGDAIRASAEEAAARVAQADAELSQIEQEQARANRLPEKQQGVARPGSVSRPAGTPRRPVGPRPLPATAGSRPNSPARVFGRRSTAWSSHAP